MIKVASNRYSTTGVSLRKLGLVFHTAEGGETNTSLKVLRAAFTVPGTRKLGDAGRTYGSCYNALPDVAHPDQFEEILTDEKGPFAAPPCNKAWLHFVFPGYAKQTRAEWLDKNSSDYLWAGARYAVAMARRHGFPLFKIGPNELLAGDRGYTDHLSVHFAWGETDHVDVGPGFPWDVLKARIALLSGSQPPHTLETDMGILIQPYTPGTPNLWDDAMFAVSGGLATYIATNADAQVLRDRGLVQASGVQNWERGWLGALRLVGPAPTYPAGYPASKSRTFPADFESQVL